MMSLIVELLEQLVSEYKNIGEKPDSLRPGITQQELSSAYPGIDLPDDLVQLYGWHNGGLEFNGENGLVFRDNDFLSVSDAIRERDSLVPLYVHPDGYERKDSNYTEIDFDKWIPFAGSNGVIYLMVCGRHIYGDDLENPIISVGGGELIIYYDSLRAMLLTCIDWISHPEYETYRFVKYGHENEIWEKHNPGIVSRRARASASRS